MSADDPAELDCLTCGACCRTGHDGRILIPPEDLLRWRASGLEVALSRIISDRLSLTLGTTRGAKRRAKMIRRFAKHRRAARVADFFCDTHGEALAAVVLAARTVSIEYATPKTQVHRDVFHRYSCRAERSAPIAGLRLIEEDGALSLAGVGGAR